MGGRWEVNALEENRELLPQRCESLSRKIFWSGSFTGLLFAALRPIELTHAWLKIIESSMETMLLIVTILSGVISIITPGLLFVAFFPRLGYAWLRGINPIVFPSKPWNQLSVGMQLCPLCL